MAPLLRPTTRVAVPSKMATTGLSGSRTSWAIPSSASRLTSVSNPTAKMPTVPNRLSDALRVACCTLTVSERRASQGVGQGGWNVAEARPVQGAIAYHEQEAKLAEATRGGG